MQELLFLDQRPMRPQWQNEDCKMKTERRAAAEQLLNEATEVLKAAGKNREAGADKTLDQLFRLSLALRSELAEAEPDHHAACINDSRPTAESSLHAITPTTIVNEDVPPKDQQHHLRHESWLSRAVVPDFTLARADRLFMIGMCVLAWLIEPAVSDSPLALSGLMFVRVVPVFILGGSLFGHALAGAIVGAGLFFGLLGAGAMSAVMWDTGLLESSAKLLGHASGVANMLYLFAAVGLSLCVVGSFAVWLRKRPSRIQYWQWTTQICVLVQLALIVELGYTGWRYAAHPERRSANVTTMKKLNRQNAMQRT
jgi:hypothetical protein